MTSDRLRGSSAVLTTATTLLGVFLIKLAVFFQLGHEPLLVPSGQADDALYAHLADRVAHGDLWLADPASFAGHPPPAFFFAPLYVYVLALLLKVGSGSLAVVRVVQLALGTIGVGLLSATSRRRYGESASMWTTAFAALFGLATFFEMLTLPVALDPFLTALDVYLIARAIERPTARVWGLAGAALGLHALNRPSFVLVLGGLTLVVCVWMVRRARANHQSPGRALAVGLGLLAAGLVVIAPATLRNWRVSRELVVISTGIGVDLLAGNGPEADGTPVRTRGIEPGVASLWLQAPIVASQALGREVGGAGADRYFQREAVKWMRAYPGEALSLLARKVRYAVGASFIAHDHSFPFYSRDLVGALTVCLVGPTLIVPLGFVALVLGPRGQAGNVLWAAYPLLALASIVLFVVDAERRIPMQIALLVPAGGAAAWISAELRAKSWATAAKALASVAILAVLVAWPIGHDDGRTEEQVKMGLYDIRTGRQEQGEAWVARALARSGAPATIDLRVGQLYESMNRPSDAIVRYRAGLSHNPTDASLQFALGRALFAAGQDAEAVSELERARAGSQGDAATRVLVLALSRMGRTVDANRLVQTLDPAHWTADQAREFAAGLASVGRLDLSVTAWRRAAEAGGDPRDYERLGLTWVMLGRAGESIGPLEEAVRRAPTSATLRLNYAVALDAVGRHDDALRETAAAIALDPTYTKAREFLDALKNKKKMS